MASQPLKLLVGRDHKEYFIHKAAFALISPVLECFIEGRKSAECEGVAVWESIEESDFLGLCEFAYSGKYSVPEIEGEIRKLPLRPKGEAAKVYGDGRELPALHEMKKQEDARDAVLEFLDKYERCRGPELRYCLPLPMSRNRDWTPYLLRHVHMCLLGFRYDVAGLLSFAIPSLASALASYRETWDSARAIVELIRLIYDKTKPGNDLRDLISMYVALKSEDLFLHDDVDATREEYPEFASDVLAYTLKFSRAKSKYWNDQGAQRKRKGSDGEDRPERDAVKRVRCLPSPDATI
ncbi:hypothetical protein F4776DRAFT_105178 [Hypoxylon sp. NC0597]|nr:hypothetical protein F4776DRAFT_105178 [Hypoxylon sp. NC0597]